MFRYLHKLAATALLIGMVSAASGQATTVQVPDQSRTSVLTATVGEQCRITVPASISFAVLNVNAATASSPVTVSIDNIVLANATRRLRVLVRAVGINFTPPFVGDSTWASADVSWNAPAWQNGAGFAGVLNSVVFVRMAETLANVPNTNTGSLIFTLAARPTVRRAGNHTLNMTWRVEAF